MIYHFKSLVLVREGRSFYTTLYQEVFFGNPGGGGSLSLTPLLTILDFSTTLSDLFAQVLIIVIIQNWLESPERVLVENGAGKILGTMLYSSRPISISTKRGYSSLHVAVRLQPMNDKEKKHDTLQAVTASTTEKNVILIKGNGAQQFGINSTLIECWRLSPNKKISLRRHWNPL